MSNPSYVRSTDGNNTDNGSTWALANADLTGTIADIVAGDTVYVSQAHAQTQASALTLTFPGTAASPNNIICANDGAEPPTAVATTATVTTTGASNMALQGCFYAYGITFSAGTGNTNASLTLANGASDSQVYENCSLQVAASATGGNINFGSTTATVVSTVTLKNCTFKFGMTSPVLAFNNCVARFENCSLAAGSAAITVMTGLTDCAGPTFIGCDLSAANSSLSLVPATARGGLTRFIDCKLPSSWTCATPTYYWGNRVEVYNSDNTVLYTSRVYDYAGTLLPNVTNVRSGGASDGTTALAWTLSTTANAKVKSPVFCSLPIAIWNDVTGSSKTATIEYLHDTNVAAGQGAGTASAFQNNQVWLEVMYPSDSGGSSLGTWVSGSPADILATPSDNAAGVGTGSWTTTGLTTPKSGKITVSFTAQQKGYIYVRVCMGAASKTVYVDPKVTIT